MADWLCVAAAFLAGAVSGAGLVYRLVEGRVRRSFAREWGRREGELGRECEARVRAARRPPCLCRNRHN